MNEREKELFKLALKVCQACGRAGDFTNIEACPKLKELDASVANLRECLTTSYLSEMSKIHGDPRNYA